MKKLVTLFLFLLIANFSFAQQETLAVDTSFGSDGILTPELPDLNITDMMLKGFYILENDKVLFVFDVEISNYSTYLIFRCNSDGSLDNTYNSPSGYVQLEEINDIDLRNKVTTNPALTEENDLILGYRDAICKLNADGNVDTSFGEAGVRTYEPFPEGMLSIIENNGSIYRVIANFISDNRKFQKLLSNGDIDEEYGSGGGYTSPVISITNYDGNPNYMSFKFRSDGGFYFLLSSYPYGQGSVYNSISAKNFNPEGFSIASNTLANSNFGEGDPYSGASIVHNDKLILNYSLYNHNGGIYTYRSKRFNSDLSLDETYGFNETHLDFPFALSVNNANDNKLWFFSEYNDEKIISRINENGTFDTGFSGNGTFTLSNLGLGVNFNPGFKVKDNSLYFPSDNFTIVKLNVIENLSTQDIGKKDVKIYPNPATDKLYFENLEKPSTVKILNAEGKFIMEKTVEPKGFIDISALPKGVYVVILDGSSYKFIKN